MKVTVIMPQGDAARAELERRIAIAHADHATKMIQQLHCSTDQKQRLMDAAIARLTQKRQAT